MKTSVIKGVAIGEGIPKICVPLVGKTLDELRDEALLARSLGADLAELRIDCFGGIAETAGPERAAEAARAAAEAIPERPLLFTFRTRREGGASEIGDAAYAAINRAACDSGVVDLIDVELFTDPAVRDEIIGYARSRGIAVVVSNHDFFATPPREELVARLLEAERVGGDIPKIAVMPKSAEDLLTLLAATDEARRRMPGRPLITMAMGGLGALSRISGEIFGSAVTFGSAAKASAPGQIPVEKLRAALALVHGAL